MLTNGANQSTIKRSNRRLIFDVLNTFGKCSRTHLAEVTGLTKASVSNIVTEMIAEGIISEGEETGSGVGRKYVMLEISSNSPCAVSLSINRDALFVSDVNLKGEILFEQRIQLAQAETEDSLLQKIFLACDTAMSNTTKPLWGIGIASIGPLDLKEGCIISPPNFNTIKNFQIIEPLQKKYGVDVALDNDMNAAALGEKLFGLGRKFENFVYLGISRGVGAGIILNNEVYRGSTGLAGEIGHICLDYKGRRCQCGARGCLEMYASISAIENEVKEQLVRIPDSPLAATHGNWNEIVSEANSGNRAAENLISTMTEYLSAALISVCNMYNPQVIFLGHEGALASNLIVESLEKSINEQIFSKDFGKVKIQTSFFGTDSYKVSGAAVIINKHLG